VSAAYLSALEHGRRGAPSWPLQKTIGYFNIIWDEAEELEQLAWSSHSKGRDDTVGCRRRPRSCEQVGRAHTEFE
jgi:hypothetical protein